MPKRPVFWKLAREFHCPKWQIQYWRNYPVNTPIVDGKCIDPATGDVKEVTTPTYGDDTPLDEIRVRENEQLGPPAVFVEIRSSTTQQIINRNMALPLELVLTDIAHVIRDRGLKVNSLIVTPYYISVAMGMDSEEFEAVCRDIFLGRRLGG
ncbi:hypothetical protein QBC47DRAFT_360137 [Echria macrotheca]|uniref:Uncharacterized protein n=1 Tax=Echria macrotheca TaxID=438768 RepID=A0AAJ0FAL9_9PEZI|nr:hypothetical protein QBC47DRAFT_360137 [Echria macrotheca]